ncbi:MAG: HNH endonuclease signature motif containing protein [Ornithinibacter sp.]
MAGVVQASQAVGYEHLTEFEARLYATDVSGLPKPRLVERARRAALKSDPAGAAHAVRSAPTRRMLSVVPSESAGLMRWTAGVPDELSARMFAAVDALAQEYLTADGHARAAGSSTKRSVGAARVDALGDPVMANAAVQTVVELVVPVEAGTASSLVTRPDPRTAAEDLMGSRDDVDQVLVGLVLGHNTVDSLAAGDLERDLGLTLGQWLEVQSNPFLDQAGERVWFVLGPVEAPGAGSILPEQVLALPADADTRVRVRRDGPGCADGTPERRHTYRPGKALAAAVRARDGHCRFRGCSVPATRCHLDHVIPFRAGESVEGNLHALCPAHHGFKHHAGSTLTMTPEGDCTWTAPTGRTHTTTPISRRDHAA